ncbi:dienelactone hydrolase family protein [Maribacter sp.]|nr:dienelactone hydrolase family protein [Maribacter sp.]
MKSKLLAALLVIIPLVGVIAQDLSESPRHQEWVDFTRDNGTILKAFVVYPESEKPTKSVIVIHENRGLNDWARSFADELAGKGYLVIAPDIISNTVAGIEKTTDFPDSDTAREAIYALDAEQVTKDLHMVYEHVKNDSSSTGEVSVAGFCWGGSQTFRYATNNPDLENAFVFYGTGPKEAATYSTIQTPVYGFYGGSDNRVNATVPDSEAIMKEAGKQFEYEIYDGAGHAFMRKGAEETEGPNKKAHDKAWARLLNILK